jgi:FG-GAP repeat protein
MKALAASFAVLWLVSVPLRAEDVWNEQRAVPDEAGAGAQFGSAVSLDGSLALFGADGENGAHGAAYFYAKGDAGWTELQRITADDPNAAEFGFRTMLRDDIAIVTADMSGPNTGQGAAYVFSPDGTGSWTQTQILSLADGTGFDNFGSAIALDGDRVVIGAHGVVIGDNFGQGAAYFFARSADGWSQMQEILADDGAMNDNFGNSATMVGDTLFIGANAATVDGVFAEGAVYVYQYDGEQWNQVQKLTETAGTTFDFFGITLAFDGTTLMVGATESGGGHGSVYVFTNDGTEWVQQQRLTVDDLVNGADFGNAIALHDGQAVIGADIQTVDGFTSRGAAYLFNFDGSQWTLGHTFVSSDGTTDDFFGQSIGYDGTTVVISTLHPNANQGAAYFYTNDTIFADGFDD